MKPSAANAPTETTSSSAHRRAIAELGHLEIDRERTRRRILADIEHVSGRSYTSSDHAICRYAYVPEYERTVRWFAERFRELNFEVWQDPLGTLVAQNRPRGTRVFGLGSHCDSNRNGGRWDGTLGVVIALEVSRLAREYDLELPLRAIAFVEEEGSGFGQMLLGSMSCAGRVTEEELRRHLRSIDDGRSFWDHAVDAGYRPDRWRECATVLDDLEGWIECHIEQGRQLQDAPCRLGVVEGIAGYIQADLTLSGRADHAGSTPMGSRSDALAAAAEIVLELERLVTAAGHATVGTAGRLEVEPGLINVVPGLVRMTLDIRGADDASCQSVAAEIATFASDAADRRRAIVNFRVRQSVPATPLNDEIARALDAAAAAAGEPSMRIVSGAAHDTVCVADRAPSGMVFVPCVDGISHAPEEDSDPADAALAAEVILNATATLCKGIDEGVQR